MLLLTRHALIQEDLNARNHTVRFKCAAVGSLETPLKEILIAIPDLENYDKPHFYSLITIYIRDMQYIQKH